MKEFFNMICNPSNEVTLFDTLFTAFMGISAVVTGDIFLAVFAISFYEHESYAIGFNLPK